MANRLPIEELSRQPLLVGTTCFTDPTGMQGFKTDQVQASALVRIAAALEAAQRPAPTGLDQPVRFTIARALHPALFRRVVEAYGKDSRLSLYAKIISENGAGLFEVEVSSADDIFYLGIEFEQARLAERNQRNA